MHVCACMCTYLPLCVCVCVCVCVVCVCVCVCVCVLCAGTCLACVFYVSSFGWSHYGSVCLHYIALPHAPDTPLSSAGQNSQQLGAGVYIATLRLFIMVLIL